MTRDALIAELLANAAYLRAVIYRYGLHEHAEDILQDVAIAVWAGAPFEGRCPVRNWLALLTARGSQRYRQGQQLVDLREAESRPGPRESVEIGMVSECAISRLHRCIGALQARWRMATLRYLAGEPFTSKRQRNDQYRAMLALKARMAQRS